MDARLLQISVNGDVAALHQLLQEEPLVLDTVTIPVTLDTPLHIASLLGHADLVAEILRLKPGLALVRDKQGLYPLHLASTKGHGSIVKKILEVDASSRLCHDKDGRIPLHLAAANNHVALLKELLPANQSFSQALTDKGETVLHSSVKYNQFEAAKFVVENFKELINMKDENGNTALHLATTRRHGKILKLLLRESTTEVNALNECGCTALDLLLQCPSCDIGDMEVCELLLSHGCKKGRQVRSSPQQIASPPKKRWTWKSMLRIGLNKKDDTWFQDMHSTIMIVSTVIASATFQTGLNPPGKSHVDVTPFMIFDAIALGASMLVILSLVSGLPLKNRLMTWVLIITLWVAVSSMALAFWIGAESIEESDYSTVFIVLASILICWLLAMAIMISYHVVVMLIKLIRCILNSCNSCRGGYGNAV